MQSSAHLNSPCASCIFTRWSVTRILTCFGQQGIRRWKKKRSASEIKQSNCVHPRKLTELKWYSFGSRWNEMLQVAKQIISPTCQPQKSISEGLLLFVEMVEKQNLWNQWDVKSAASQKVSCFNGCRVAIHIGTSTVKNLHAASLPCQGKRRVKWYEMS